jgi:predicted nuclease of restriction endonuclease-like (RecB) superfamily
MENGCSRASLVMWIESDLYGRQGKAITNFRTTLPELYSDLAEQTLKDPYNFDFLTTDKKAREREIELGLMSHIQKFLLELGQGFAFIGRQYPVTVGTKDFFIDKLFYHIALSCFVVLGDLKKSC